MALNRRITYAEDPSVAAKLQAEAEAEGVSVGHVVRQAVRRHLNPQAYDDLAAVLEAAAERIRREQGAA